MNFNVNELLNSLSFTLDYVEKGLISNEKNHGRRVAYISARIGEMLGFNNLNLFDLISYSLLHDNGVAKSLVKKTDSGEYVNAELNSIHCVEGEKNIKVFPFFHPVTNVILYHHENYDGSGFFGLSGSEIPLYSRIIALADFIAIQYSEDRLSEDVIRSIEESKSYFDPDLLCVFQELSRNMEFWLHLNDDFVYTALTAVTPHVNRNFDYKNMRTVSQVFCNIIDSKSPFTGSHSRGISDKTGILCEYYEFDQESYWKMRIAADLHDLGKLMVPNEILDKPAALTKQEILIIQSHPFYTRKALEMITGFEEIADCAANHHEKLNGSGYPYGLNQDQLDYKSRLLGCIDIYQALTEDRPYRKAMPHNIAIRIMREMASKNLIDESIVEDLNFVFSVTSKFAISK